MAQCEDLKLKYYEEMAKRKKLHNIVQETKGISFNLYFSVLVYFYFLLYNLPYTVVLIAQTGYIVPLQEILESSVGAGH